MGAPVNGSPPPELDDEAGTAVAGPAGTTGSPTVVAVLLPAGPAEPDTRPAGVAPALPEPLAASRRTPRPLLPAPPPGRAALATWARKEPLPPAAVTQARSRSGFDRAEQIWPTSWEVPMSVPFTPRR